MIKTRGFTIPELLVYAAIMGFVTAFVIGGMLSLNKSVVVSRASRDVNISAATALERMVRELKDASGVVEVASVLGVNPGVLTITTTNASTTGGTMKFSLSGGQIMLTTNATSSLTAGSVNVSRLVFYNATSTNSSAVRIEMTVLSTSTQNRYYYDTAVLRESYVQ
ncbi:MAG TPA: hypothetical protein VI953_02585 [Candidatus Paceibacterota bacterium]